MVIVYDLNFLSWY